MAEEPCQCDDCQRFYKEHDRLIREFPTFKHQQELNWASIQSFRTLCNKVTDELQRELSERQSDEDTTPFEKNISDLEITEASVISKSEIFFSKGVVSSSDCLSDNSLCNSSVTLLQRVLNDWIEAQFNSCWCLKVGNSLIKRSCSL